MTSGRVSSTVSGAAQGAAYGSMVPVVGTAVGAVIGGVAGFISGSASDRQQANALAWAQYNRQSNYNTSMANIQTGMTIAGFNAALAIKAGNVQAAQIRAGALYNANIMRLTTEYHLDLLDDQLTQVWNAHSLDSTQIEMYRQRERGDVRSEMGASGTLIEGSGNQAVLADQRTMEAMDLAVVLHNANGAAANISNEIAQGHWNGKVAIQQTLWEGEQAAFNAQYNARAQAVGSVGTAIIQSGADMYNAKQAYMTEGYNIKNADYAYGQQQQQDMIKGLFSAAATYGTAAYARKIPGGSTAGKSLSTGSTTRNYSTFGNNVNLGKMRVQPSLGRNLTEPGTSVTLGLGG